MSSGAEKSKAKKLANKLISKGTLTDRLIAEGKLTRDMIDQLRKEFQESDGENDIK